jgi:hypothetical protein
MIQEVLASLISESEFLSVWSIQPPPYQLFLTAASEKLEVHVPGEFSGLTGRISSSGSNRIRIDGVVTVDNVLKIYYLELVWMPTYSSYRGQAIVWDSPPPIKPKTVNKFIAELECIVDSQDDNLEGQTYDAVSGLDDKNLDITDAFQKIFDLFEKFPDGDFGAPGPLVHLLETNDAYLSLLMASIARKPSLPAVLMINRILNSDLSLIDRNNWIYSLESIVKSSVASECVQSEAAHFLEYQKRRNM